MSAPGCQATSAALLHVLDRNYQCFSSYPEVDCEKIHNLEPGHSLLRFYSAVQIICTEEAVRIVTKIFQRQSLLNKDLKTAEETLLKDSRLV